MNNSLLLTSLMENLHQGEHLLKGLTPEVYCQKVPLAFNASIGGHYRHALEHIALLLGLDKSGSSDAALDYDLRARELSLETDVNAALVRTRALLARCEEWHQGPIDIEQEITLRCKTSYAPDAPSTEVKSNLARELMFIISHTVHHYALIGLMCGMQDFAVPAGFGVAPSTLKHQISMQKG